MEHVFALTMTAVSSLQPLTHPCDTSTTREKADVCLHACCHIIVVYYLIYIKQLKYLQSTNKVWLTQVFFPLIVQILSDMKKSIVLQEMTSQ